MDISIHPVSDQDKRAKPTDEGNLGFGKIYSDHMFTVTWDAGKGWHDATIGPYQDFAMSPAALVLHYG